MVVLNPIETAASLEKKKKTRRKQSKKVARVADPKEIQAALEQDADMEEGPSDIPTTFTQGGDNSAESNNDDGDDDDTIMIDNEEDTIVTSTGSNPLNFAPLSAAAQAKALGTKKSEMRRIPMPPHRMTPLKKEWVNVFGPLTELLGLQIRMNVQRRCVEIRTSKHTKEIGSLQKGADFVKAFALGFDVNDAIALLRMDDLYLDSFEIKDVKTLHGDHLSRAIGRIAGQDGKTKFTIENASRTRIILADTKIHILGTFQNIKVARDAIVSLILGSPPGKVYAGLRTVASRMRQRAI